MNRSRHSIWALSSVSFLGPLALYVLITLLDGAIRGRFPTPLQGFVAAGPAALTPLVVYMWVGQTRRGLTLSLIAFLFLAILPATVLVSEPAPPDRAGSWYGVMDVVVWGLVVPTGLFIESVVATLGLLFQTRYLRPPALRGSEPLLERWEIGVFVAWALFAPPFMYWAVMLLWGGSNPHYTLPITGLIAASCATFAPVISYAMGGYERRGLKLAVPAWLILGVVPAVAMSIAHFAPRVSGEYSGVVDSFVWVWGVPLGLFVEALFGALDLERILQLDPASKPLEPLLD